MRYNIKPVKHEYSRLLHQYAMYSLAVAFMYVLMVSDAHAVGGQLCAMIGAVMGGMGRAIATVGVLMVGVGATLGRMSWTLAITVAVGIAAMFAATSIAMSLGSNGGCFGT